MLTDKQLKNWRLTDTAIAKHGPKKGERIPLRRKTDRDGLYAEMTDSGAISFRYDYTVNARRETLTLGRYDESPIQQTL